MGAAGVEVVPRAVEVHRQEVDRVEPVLLPVGLRLHEEQLLGQPIGGVGLLRIAAPEVLLPERHGGELRIGADRADGHELLEPGLPGMLHEHRPHDEVLVVEAAGVLTVGPDAPHDRRQVDDDVGAVRLVHPADLLFVDEVELGLAHRHDRGGRAAALAQLLHHGETEEAGAAGHDDLLLAQVDHVSSVAVSSPVPPNSSADSLRRPLRRPGTGRADAGGAAPADRR